MGSRCLLIFFITLGLIFSTVSGGLSLENRTPVKLDGKQILPLRVLARSFSNVYTEKRQDSVIVRENVPAFQPFYVYTQPIPEDIELGDAWYEVGSDNRGTVVGWMKADDVFEWKQTMCLAYTHPEGRKPVLMFEKRKDLIDLLAAPEEERITKASALYSAIDTGNVAPDFPVISVEPKKAVDISQSFYLLPILDFQTMEIGGREGRAIRLAAVAGSGPNAREKTDIRTNTGYLNEATGSSTMAAEEILKKLAIDIVWVMDTTVSMRPYIEKTLDVVRNVSNEITQDKELAGAIRFGIWGYRDPVDEIPGIGYTTKNYTPSLQSIDVFNTTLAGVEVTTIDSVDYEEDMFSGMSDAIDLTRWTPEALRFIVLVGDAPGHELGHKWNLSGLDENTLRSIADDKSVYLFSLHIKEPRAKRFHESAQRQFMGLSQNKGVPEPSYYSVNASDMDDFSRITSELVSKFSRALYTAKQGRVVGNPMDAVGDVNSMEGTNRLGSMDPTAGTSAGTSTDDLQMATIPQAGDPAGDSMPLSTDMPLNETIPAVSNNTQGELGALEESVPVSTTVAKGELGFLTEAAIDTPSGAMIDSMIQAALVEWIGSQTGASAPRDIVAWAVDKDMMEPAIQSMEVRLLINKRQLDSLKTVLTDVMSAGMRGQIGGEAFFDALQATAATAARDPNLIKNAKTMAKTGLIPEFLVGLPYKSRLMDMNNELWASWSIDEQDEFLNELNARIQAYVAIHDAPDGWIKLNEGDDPDEAVYPISLELLP